MYGSVKGLTLPATGVAVLMPNTGAFKPFFFMMVAIASVGLVSLAASGIFAAKRHLGR